MPKPNYGTGKTLRLAEAHEQEGSTTEGSTPAIMASQPTDSDFGNTLDTWPLQLLHVGKMESIPRSDDKNGIHYGEAREPSYNIMSYTWGAYRDDVYGEAIAITGPGHSKLSWAVPKVDKEKAFSATEFKKVLKKVAGGGEFAWVDVACLNQVQGAPDYAVEVGKQAAIFNRANMAYVWLHQTCEEDIRNSLELMNKISIEAHNTQETVNFHEAYRTDIAKRHADLKTIERLLLDPWFSSLWTLQEAYLRRDAIILSKEGKTLYFGSSSATEPLTVGSLGNICTQVYPWIWQTTKTLIDKAGLVQLRSNNPLVLLSISARRTPERAPDRVYGIMQILGLRLGNTANGVDRKREFSLEELEEQISREIARLTPTLGQLFLHRGKTKVGRTWRLDTGIVEPDKSFTRHGAMVPGRDKGIYVPEEFCNAIQISQACEISFSDGNPLFSGSVWSLARLRDRWIRNEGQPSREPSFVSPDDPKTPDMNRFERSIFLDHWSGIHAFGVMPAGYSSWGKPVLIADSVESKYAGQLSILILGCIRDGETDKEAWVGLVASKRGAQFLRVGFCTWQEEAAGTETVVCELL